MAVLTITQASRNVGLISAGWVAVIGWLLYSLRIDEENARWAPGEAFVNEISAERKTQEQGEVYNVSVSWSREFPHTIKKDCNLKTNNFVIMLGRNTFKSIWSLDYIEHLNK